MTERVALTERQVEALRTLRSGLWMPENTKFLVPLIDIAWQGLAVSKRDEGGKFMLYRITEAGRKALEAETA